MRKLSRLNFLIAILVLIVALPCTTVAQTSIAEENSATDRVALVTQQINLLKNRLNQGEHDLTEWSAQKEMSPAATAAINKNHLVKAGLDIAVATSNLDSINIELSDCQQTIQWLDKSVHEIDNQLNVLGIFGAKTVKDGKVNIMQMHADLESQRKVLDLEKTRAKFLQKLQENAKEVLSLRQERYAQLDRIIKSRNLLTLRQQQVKDELAYQEQQNQWLQQLNGLNDRLSTTDPQDKAGYAALERDIFYASENANYAYTQSLIARYQDQIQQMKLAILRSDSISVLNEISDQVQGINKQIEKLNDVMKGRISNLNKHISYLSKRKQTDDLKVYINKLAGLNAQYHLAISSLASLNIHLAEVRGKLEKALQTELSLRQGLPSFSMKAFLDLGKEMLFVPPLTFQITKSLTNQLYKDVRAVSSTGWYVFAAAELLLLSFAFFLRRWVQLLVLLPFHWRDQINSKWLSLQWFNRSFIDLLVIGNGIGLLFYFGVPVQNFNFLIYLSFVWIIFKTIIIIARICLVESTHDTSGHDVRLYHRLKWFILAGAIITALTVFVHQLPSLYELTTLCDRLFLLLMMMVSILLLRSSDVVPNLIVSHMKSKHPYLQKSIRLVGVLVPLIMIGNSVIGLLGFMNLIMTVSWYEGIFMMVLIGYLVVRGLLSDAMEQLSRLLIQYVNNGWLWTEAFLKPLDKVLRITLFLTGWAVLFLAYGWDKQSPIVERLTRLLQYHLVNVLNTTITPQNILELLVVISVFYWTAKWTREFVYRMLLSRTNDMGIRNSIAILSQYCVVIVGALIGLKVLGINLQALTMVAGMFAFGVGLGLRDLANNFACGFLILLERPLRVGDIINVSDNEGEVTHIGGRAVTVRTWDHMELVIPNTEIFNKLFTNWTAKDNIVRSVVPIKISRHDNPHEVKVIIQHVLFEHKEVLKEPVSEVYLRNLSEHYTEFEVRYYVNIRQVKSRTNVISSVLMKIWDEFAKHGIKPPYPQHEIFLHKPAQATTLEVLEPQRIS